MNARRQRFVAEYLACRNAPEAARRAGYSPFTAAAAGSLLLRVPSILAALCAAGIETGATGELLRPLWRGTDGLNARQHRFVAEYARSRNAHDAALRAGYAPSAAQTFSVRLLRHKAVIAALRKAGVVIVRGVHPRDQRRKEACRVRTNLTMKQQRFVDEYLASGKSSEAARRAGYAAGSPNAAAARLLRHPLVKAALAAERQKLAERAQIDGARVLAEYGRIAFASVADLLDWGPEGVRLKPGILDADLAAAVLELTLAADGAPGNVRIKMQPKLQALEALGKHLGLWEKSARGMGGGSPPKPERNAEERAEYERLRERIRAIVEAARAAAAKKAA